MYTILYIYTFLIYNILYIYTLLYILHIKNHVAQKGSQKYLLTVGGFKPHKNTLVFFFFFIICFPLYSILSSCHSRIPSFSHLSPIFIFGTYQGEGCNPLFKKYP